MYTGTLAGQTLRSPALLVAFEGWVSAGSAGTATAELIAADGEQVVEFESEGLYDYRVNRPVLDFVDGIMTNLQWPRTVIRLVSRPERDLLVLTGPEPNWRWPSLGEAVAQIAIDAGVVQHVSLGGVPWAAPHTRPTAILTTASRTDLISHDANFPEGLLRVPASAASVIERYVAESGIPTVGFWARVPHYVGGVYHPAVLALVEQVSRHLGVDIPLGSLADDAADQRRHLDEAVGDQPGIAEIVEQLEDVYDASGDIAGGEELAAEIERYLRERSEED